MNMDALMYFLWDIRVIQRSMPAIFAPAERPAITIRVAAWTKEQAIEKAMRLVDGEEYQIVSVGEYWLPGAGIEQIARSLDKMAEKGA